MELNYDSILISLKDLLIGYLEISQDKIRPTYNFSKNYCPKGFIIKINESFNIEVEINSLLPLGYIYITYTDEFSCRGSFNINDEKSLLETLSFLISKLEIYLMELKRSERGSVKPQNLMNDVKIQFPIFESCENNIRKVNDLFKTTLI